MVETQASPANGYSDGLKAWLPVILWGLIISMFSTSLFSSYNTSNIIEPILRWLLPAASTVTISLLHAAIRKAGHFTEYAVLFWLLVRRPLGERPLMALMLCLGYALLDEAHQMFVPVRTPSLYDVGLDFSGALFSNFLRRGMLALGYA